MRDLFCALCFAMCCGVSGAALVLALRAMEASEQQAMEAMNAEPENAAPEPGLALLFLQGLALSVLFIGFLILAFGYQP